MFGIWRVALSAGYVGPVSPEHKTRNPQALTEMQKARNPIDSEALTNTNNCNNINKNN